jgi:mRNA interferase HicA
MWRNFRQHESAGIIRQIEQTGCIFIRHGARDDWRRNPKTGACQPVPRHNEIKDYLARYILKKLKA